ncbi:MAG: hypothetical protein WCD53_15370 [Microcoleus sp.]
MPRIEHEFQVVWHSGSCCGAFNGIVVSIAHIFDSSVYSWRAILFEGFPNGPKTRRGNSGLATRWILWGQ